MNENPAAGAATVAPDLSAASPAPRDLAAGGGALDARRSDDDIVDQWGKASFPASDPPANW